MWLWSVTRYRRVNMHSCGSKQNIDDKPWNVIAYKTLLEQNSENSSQISTKKKSKQCAWYFFMNNLLYAACVKIEFL